MNANENFQVRRLLIIMIWLGRRQQFFLLRKTKNKIKSVLHNFADRVEVRALSMRVTTSC
jgi:hypothetical protein